MATASLRVLLVHPASDLPADIQSVLRRHQRIAKLESAYDLKDVPGLIRSERYDVVVLDDDDPAVDAALPGLLKRFFPHVRIALLTRMADPTSLSGAASDASPILLRKNCSAEEFLECINGLLDPADARPSQPVEVPVPETAGAGDSIRGRARLSKRENEVFGLLLNGLSDKDIAARLGLSMQTIRQHHKSLKRKLAIAGLLDTLG